MKKFLTFLVMPLVAVALMMTAANARSPHPELNLSSSGLALRGYDPVAYFKAGKAVKGRSAISLTHRGGKYYFSSEANKDLFAKSPQKYLPAYGGYCAYGTAANAKVDGDPRIWHIVGGKLYLNITRPVDRKWRKNRNSYIKKANRNWPKIKNK